MHKVDTLEELVTTDYTWGIVNYGAADYHLFSTSQVFPLFQTFTPHQVEVYQKIFAGLELCPDPVNCMERAAAGGFAYISWKVVVGWREVARCTSRIS